jgi:hypothetical protein
VLLPVVPRPPSEGLLNVADFTLARQCSDAGDKSRYHSLTRFRVWPAGFLRLIPSKETPVTPVHARDQWRLKGRGEQVGVPGSSAGGQKPQRFCGEK